MKKISLGELKDKDLYLDDDGKIIVREKPKGRFLPKKDETYYCVSDDLSVWQTTNYGATLDLLIINRDYAFRTKEEALKVLDMIQGCITGNVLQSYEIARDCPLAGIEFNGVFNMPQDNEVEE